MPRQRYTGHAHPPRACTRLVIARLKDNVSIVLCNVPSDLHDGMRVALEALLQTIYGMAFEWEVHDTHINWCKSMLMRYDSRSALEFAFSSRLVIVCATVAVGGTSMNGTSGPQSVPECRT